MFRVCRLLTSATLYKYCTVTFWWSASQMTGIWFLKEKHMCDLCDLLELILELKREVRYPTRDRSAFVARTDLYQIHTCQIAAEELPGVRNCSNTGEVKELLLLALWHSPFKLKCLFVFFFKSCSLNLDSPQGCFIGRKVRRMVASIISLLQ